MIFGTHLGNTYNLHPFYSKLFGVQSLFPPLYLWSMETHFFLVWWVKLSGLTEDELVLYLSICKRDFLKD